MREFNKILCNCKMEFLLIPLQRNNSQEHMIFLKRKISKNTNCKTSLILSLSLSRITNTVIVSVIVSVIVIVTITIIDIAITVIRTVVIRRLCPCAFQQYIVGVANFFPATNRLTIPPPRKLFSLYAFCLAIAHHTSYFPDLPLTKRS